MDRYLRANNQMKDPFDPDNYTNDYSFDSPVLDSYEAAPSAKPAATNYAGYANAAKELTGEGNTASKAGNAMMAAGSVPSPASPYLLAGGLGLSVVGKSIEAKQAREAQAVQNEINRRQRVQQLMSNLGSGFGGLG